MRGSTYLVYGLYFRLPTSDMGEHKFSRLHYVHRYDTRQDFACMDWHSGGRETCHAT